jgi:hypothetical protein
MPHYPWKRLKTLENKLTDLVVSEMPVEKKWVTQLSRVWTQCAVAPDADEAICYHGCKALLAHFDGDPATAIKHRQIEARKIKRLYALEESNPTDGWALQDYQAEDIRKRELILKRLRAIRT